MTKIVEATEAFSTDALGFPRPVAKGETFHEKHKIVKAHPAVFSEWECDNPPETATAEPGQKRATPRKRRKRRKAKKEAKAKEAPKPKAKVKSLGKADAPGGKAK
jgi:hypothetical protein